MALYSMMPTMQSTRRLREHGSEVGPEELYRLFLEVTGDKKLAEDAADGLRLAIAKARLGLT